MDIRQIDDEYSVSGQITVEDLDRDQGHGLQVHRLPSSGPGKHGPDAVCRHRSAAKELGLDIAHVPVGPMGVTEEAVAGMVDALDGFPRRCSATAVPAPAPRRSTRRRIISAPSVSRGAKSGAAWSQRRLSFRKQENTTSIKRIDAGARMSGAVIHGNTVYLAGQVGEGESVTEQCKSALAEVDRLLAAAGSNKSKILQTLIYLSDSPTSRK